MSEEGIGKIDLVEYLLKDLKNSFLNLEFSDVTFIVDGRRFEGHRQILASRSEYFKTLLFGGFKEGTQKEIELKNTNADAFHAILEYFYTGTMDLSTLEINILLEIMRCSHEWQLTELFKRIAKYLESKLNLDNFPSLLDFSINLDLTDLLAKCLSYFDANVETILNVSTFKELTVKCVLELLKRDSMYISTAKAFQSFSHWAKNVSPEEANLVLNEFHLHLLDPIFLLTTANKSELFSIEKIHDAVLENLKAKQLTEFKVVLNKNLATLANGATLIQGIWDHALKEEPDTISFTYHRPNESIIVSLNEIYILDFIQFRLYEIGAEFKYKLEVGLDYINWELIADKSDKFYKSWQRFIFQERPIKFIKLTGIKCLYNNRRFEDEKPLYVHFIEAALKRTTFHY